MRDRALGALTAREVVPGDESNIGDADQAREEPDGAVCARNDPELVPAHERTHQNENVNPDLRLVVAHRFLHQGPLDQLARPVFVIQNPDQVLLRCSPRRRIEPHAVCRDIAQPREKIGDRDAAVDRSTRPDRFATWAPLRTTRAGHRGPAPHFASICSQCEKATQL